jgi:uncharacterized protein
MRNSSLHAECKFILAKTSILYLHGFRSSPQSSKAVLIGQALAAQGIHYACPQLDISPCIALEQMLEAVESCLAVSDRLGLIGSSLGGFYASHLMETHPQRHRFKAALLNPASYPARDLKNYIGELPSWHSDEVLIFRSEFIDDLKAMEVGLTEPDRYLLVAATGDELLDWKEMVARYPGARHHVITGSDHGLSDFDQHWSMVEKFLLT